MSIINIDHPFESFNIHFKNINNKRIMFSAPFGSGKTFFLKKYFENLNKTVNTFWLSPVKYVVSQNEDIFEYIKSDIAFQLICNPIIQVKLNKLIGEKMIISQYLLNSSKDIFNILLVALDISHSDEATGLAKLSLTLTEKLDTYKKFKDKVNKSSLTQHEALIKYIDNQLHIKGSIFEDDIISQTIRQSLIDVKLPNKKNVLIIDDLDRLDPEHIFRILNILTAHQDYYVNGESITENKFGFDAIIIVCDIDNIRNIYKHKYGAHVDFNGYIEKYYSTDVFRFVNEKSIGDFCKSLSVIGLDKNCQIILGNLLYHFLRIKAINIRSIVKFNHPVESGPFTVFERTLAETIDLYENHTSNFTSEVGDYYPIREFKILSSDLGIIKVIKILTAVFGDYQKLKSYLEPNVDGRSASYSCSVETLNAAIRSFGPFYNLITKKDRPQDMIYNYTSKPSFVSSMGKAIIPLSTVQLLDHKFKMHLGWSNQNPYQKELGLYSNLNIINETSIIEPATNTQPKNFINTIELVELLRPVCQYLEQQDMLHLMGVTR